MVLMMHGVSYTNMTLSNADTLKSDWPTDWMPGAWISRVADFDAVVAKSAVQRIGITARRS